MNGDSRQECRGHFNESEGSVRKRNMSLVPLGDEGDECGICFTLSAMAYQR